MNTTEPTVTIKLPERFSEQELFQAYSVSLTLPDAQEFLPLKKVLHHLMAEYCERFVNEDEISERMTLHVANWREAIAKGVQS